MAQPFPAALPNDSQGGSHAGLYTGSVQANGGAVQRSSLPEPSRGGQPTVYHARSAATPAARPDQSLNQQAAEISRQTSRVLQQDSRQAAANDSSASGTYVVQSGDTLTRIAGRAGVSIDTLKQVNGLSGSAIRVGQHLKLPHGASSEAVASARSGRTTAVASKDVTTASIPSPAAPQQPAAQKPEPAQKTASVETQPKSYSPPAKADESASQADTSKVALAAPQSSGIAKLRWPLHGQVVAKYGSETDGHRNDGIDISVPEGSPVKAAENGVVIYAGNGLKEYGNTVLIRHDDGLVTVYGYAKDLKVSRGDKVARGQVIADSGMSGAAKRPTLHFEVRKDAKPVNPIGYLD